MATTQASTPVSTIHVRAVASLASRDRLLIVGAILALVVAAFLVPPLDTAAGGAGSGPGGGPGDGNGTGTPTDQRASPTPGDPGGGSPPDGSPIDGQPGGDGRPDGDGQPTGEPGVSVRTSDGDRGSGDGGMNLTGTEPHPDCVLVVWDELVPGRDATVFLWNDGGPVSGHEAWFEDRGVGATNQAGRVDGRVPYVRELNVTAAAPPVTECAALHLEMAVPYDRWEAANDAPAELVLDEDAAPEIVPTTAGNASVTLPVVGNASIAVEGDAYPGEGIQLNATVRGVPMPDATVTVDGEEVGETDDRGRYNLTVPDDGTESIDVSVARGEFSASETIEVLLLSLDVSADALFALPGGGATVHATVGERPADGVRVTAAGQTGAGAAATTDAEGRAAIQLPGDPLATVRAEGHGQTTTVPVWPVYLPTVLVTVLLVGLVAGTVAASAGSESGLRARTVATAWAVVVAFVAATIVAGPIGGLAVAGLLAVGVLIHYRAVVGRTIHRARAVPLTVVRTAHGAARWLADWLGRAADRTGATVRWLLARIRAAPRSVGGLVVLVGRWLARVPGRLAHWFGPIVGTVLSAARGFLASLLSPRAILGLALAGALVAGSYVVAGPLGAVAITGLLVVGLSIVRVRGWTDDSSRDTARSPSVGGTPTVGGESGTDAVSRPTLGELWRTFARWVIPGRWRARTPGEIGRAAVDRGFPREPVEQLTEVFREVEYGDRHLSEERWDRARSAFEALRTDRPDEERGER